MASNDDSVDPVLRGDGHHHADKYGTKLVNKTDKYQQKLEHAKPSGTTDDKKGPAGGFDDTSIPQAPPGYTLRITFHRAENLPFADVPTFSSDPYIMAVLQTSLMKRHKQDSDLRLRTPTVHRNVNPKWETVWTIAHVPSSGFFMKCRLYDEDPADHDDRLGNVHVQVNHIDDNWQGFKERRFEVKKRMGSKRAYTIRGCAALLSRNVKLGGEVYISVENLGKSEGDGGRAYTVSPLPWSQHFSPLIGLLTGTKNKQEAKNGKKATDRYNFQAIQIQFQGPLPEHLYHRYVEFKPFVAGMFTSHTLRGRILNHALHHQHARIYNYDGSTKYGEFAEPCIEMTKKFLDFVHYDQGGRIFTYIITLDGQMRFTETGKEFGIDMLSKHTMHSDVSIYIAFSGEFFVRRLKQPRKDKGAGPAPASNVLPSSDERPESKDREEKQGAQSNEQGENHESLAPPSDSLTPTHDATSSSSPNQRGRSWSSFRQRSRSANSSTQAPAPHSEQTHESDEPSQDPAHYELIIDNDSGTYRPNAKYLGQLRKFLQHNLPGLRIATLDCQGDEEKMNKLKGEQRERKKKSGKQITYMQNMSMSSLSSSDEEDLERRAAEQDNGPSVPGVGAVKTQWNKVKSMTKGESGNDDAESEASSLEKAKEDSSSSTTPLKDTTTPVTSTESAKPRSEEPSTQHNASLSPALQPQKKNSMSTSEGKNSFDTATEHGDSHFVTPKPSLGDGGLKSFLKPQKNEEEDRPLSRGINDELKKRGLDGIEDKKV